MTRRAFATSFSRNARRWRRRRPWGWPRRAPNQDALAVHDNGSTISWVVAMPDLGKASKGRGRFYKGASEKEGEGLRALVLGTEPDGSRVMYNCAVEGRTANPALLGRSASAEQVALHGYALVNE
jgi:hypothetical protein